MTGGLIKKKKKVFDTDLTKYIKYEYVNGRCYNIENSPQIKEL